MLVQDHHRLTVPGETLHDGQPFGAGLGIGNGSFHRRDFQVWKDQRIRVPVAQFGMKLFLAALGVADDPHPLVRLARVSRQQRDQEGLRGGGDMLEANRFARLHRCHLPCQGCTICGASKKRLPGIVRHNRRLLGGLHGNDGSCTFIKILARRCRCGHHRACPLRAIQTLRMPHRSGSLPAVIPSSAQRAHWMFSSRVIAKRSIRLRKVARVTPRTRAAFSWFPRVSFIAAIVNSRSSHGSSCRLLSCAAAWKRSSIAAWVLKVGAASLLPFRPPATVSFSGRSDELSCVAREAAWLPLTIPRGISLGKSRSAVANTEARCSVFSNSRTLPGQG